MELVASRKDLLRALQCYTLAAKKSPMPILTNVLLTAKDGSLSAVATDTFMSMRGTCEAEVMAPGALGLPAKDLFDRVKAMPEGPVHFKYAPKESKVQIRSTVTRRWFDLSAILPNDFPAIPQPDPHGPVWTADASALSLLLSRTHFAVQNDGDANYNRGLILVWRGDGKVQGLATDGKRMSVQSVACEGPDAPLLSLTAESVSTLRKLVDAHDAEVRIQRAGAVAFFTFGSSVFSCRTIPDISMPPLSAVLAVAKGVPPEIGRAHV